MLYHYSIQVPNEGAFDTQCVRWRVQIPLGPIVYPPFHLIIFSHTLFSLLASIIVNFNLLFHSLLESHNLPAKPSLELAVGQIKSCLNQMAKSGLGVCAFATVDDFVNR